MAGDAEGLGRTPVDDPHVDGDVFLLRRNAIMVVLLRTDAQERSVVSLLPLSWQDYISRGRQRLR